MAGGLGAGGGDAFAAAFVAEATGLGVAIGVRAPGFAAPLGSICAITEAPSSWVCFVVTVLGARSASEAIFLIFGDVMGSTPFMGGFTMSITLL